jgi:MFS transporter, MFS domain-containing protein family, molybdate-anion transporter
MYFQIVINTMEHVPDMTLLMVGRVLGGLSTSLLFTSFESWMVSEHRRRGFPESWLASTFTMGSAGNGLAAIAAGLLAQRASDLSGDIGPFQVAIALTVITLILILTWRENYGSEHDNMHSIWQSMAESTKMITKHKGILCLGLSQAFFEAAIYTFGNEHLIKFFFI